MSMSKAIEEKLRKGLTVSHLEVVNESYKHQGHAGDDGSGESHFKIVVEALEFNGVNTVSCHRKIYSVLEEEMERIHALSIVLKK